jgi:hypothetical protein
MSDAIQVTGLRELVKTLRQISSDMPKAVRLALNQSAELVINRARPDIPTRSGKAARSIRPQSTRTAVRVSAGGNRAPYYPWLDFGGRTGRRRATVRPFHTDGRYLYPAYYKLRDSGEFTEVMSAALVEVARSAGLEVA